MRHCTFDTNVAVYAFSPLSGKSDVAERVLARADFASVQVLNEFAHVAKRKMRLSWPDVRVTLQQLRDAVETVLPITHERHGDALRIATRYELTFYDSLMLSVALSGGAHIFYSEDMQHGMAIDETLRVVNPFVAGALDQ